VSPCASLLATERKIIALWQAIERARAAGDWRARPSRLCDWCNHKALCPEFGCTPPPLPPEGGMPPRTKGDAPLPPESLTAGMSRAKTLSTPRQAR